jgi:hypothetical protein
MTETPDKDVITEPEPDNEEELQQDHDESLELGVVPDDTKEQLAEEEESNGGS